MVTIELSTLDDGAPDEGCALTITHEGFADEGARDAHLEGWSDCLDRLPAWPVAA